MPFPLTDEDTRAGGAGLARPSTPTAPAGSILAVARRFDIDDADRSADGIPSAVRLDDTTGTYSFTRPACLPDDFTKSAEPTATYWDFHAAGFYVPVGCDHTAPNWDRWAARSKAKLEASTAARIARRLWFDSVNAGTGYASPSLMSTATLVGGSTALAPAHAMGVLLQAYFDASTDGDPVFHVPPILAPFVKSVGLISEVNGKFVGPMDVPVSFGPYPANVGADGAAIVSATETRIAISGPIYAEAGTPFEAAAPYGVSDPYEGRANPRLNQNSVIFERREITAFDPGVVFAAKTYVPSPTTAAPV